MQELPRILAALLQSCLVLPVHNERRPRNLTALPEVQGAIGIVSVADTPPMVTADRFLCWSLVFDVGKWAYNATLILSR